MKKGSHHSDATRKRLSEINKGKRLSDETKKKISKGLIGKPPTIGMTGKHHSDETKKKISDAQKGISKINGGTFKKGHIVSEETRKKISKSKTGKPSKKKGIPLSEEMKVRISDTLKGRYSGKDSPNWKGRIKRICKNCGIEMLLAQWQVKKKNSGTFCSIRCHAIWKLKHMKNHDTDIEIIMETALTDRDIPFLKQVPICGIALVDFLLSNKIIVQCDGDYWHSEKKNKGKDKRQDKILKSNGYKVYRFWGSEIKESVDDCIDKIFLSEDEKALMEPCEDMIHILKKAKFK